MICSLLAVNLHEILNDFLWQLLYHVDILLKLNILWLWRRNRRFLTVSYVSDAAALWCRRVLLVHCCHLAWGPRLTFSCPKRRCPTSEMDPTCIPVVLAAPVQCRQVQCWFRWALLYCLVELAVSFGVETISLYDRSHGTADVLPTVGIGGH